LNPKPPLRYACSCGETFNGKRKLGLHVTTGGGAPHHLEVPPVLGGDLVPRAHGADGGGKGEDGEGQQSALEAASTKPGALGE
jgi:hypothetical protein